LGRKVRNLNSLIENQGSDFNLQMAFRDTLTCHMLRPFKFQNTEKIATMRKSFGDQASNGYSFRSNPVSFIAENQLKLRRDRESI
jgi:hypothetical protein